jgi:hypothetical protein
MQEGQAPAPQAGSGAHGAAPQAVSGAPEPTAWAEISFCRSLPPQWLHVMLSRLLRTSVSNLSPQLRQ